MSTVKSDFPTPNDVIEAAEFLRAFQAITRVACGILLYRQRYGLESLSREVTESTLSDLDSVNNIVTDTISSLYAKAKELRESDEKSSDISK